MDKRTRYPQEVRERAVRMVFEHSPSCDSRRAAIKSISSKFGVSTEDAAAVGQAGRDRRRAAARPERRANPHEGARAREPRVASRQRDLKECRGFLRGGGRPPTEEVVDYIDANRGRFGVEPICEQLPIAPSTYAWWLK